MWLPTLLTRGENSIRFSRSSGLWLQITDRQNNCRDGPTAELSFCVYFIYLVPSYRLLACLKHVTVSDQRHGRQRTLESPGAWLLSLWSPAPPLPESKLVRLSLRRAQSSGPSRVDKATGRRGGHVQIHRTPWPTPYLVSKNKRSSLYLIKVLWFCCVVMATDNRFGLLSKNTFL